jgi:hypothetical protein
VTKAPIGADLVSIEAHEKIDAWSDRARELFTELLEDAPSDLQRELLNRAVAAGHTVAEVHAFADALRGLSDGDAFDACTIERDSAPDYGVVQLLKAEADPVFAFKLKGGELSPADEEPPRAPEKPTAPYAPPGAPGRARPGFDTSDDGALKRTPQQAARELGSSPDDPNGGRAKIASGSVPAAPPAATGPILVQDLLNESMHALGVTYREQAVDGPGQLKLEDALIQAAPALLRGLPVPVALGPAPGSDRRLAVILQVQHSGKSRAYQLFDVVSQEIAWINEGDLLARTELPFSSKTNRRITRVALPSSRSF